MYTPYMTVCLTISLPTIPYIHRSYMVLANPTNQLASIPQYLPHNLSQQPWTRQLCNAHASHGHAHGHVSPSPPSQQTHAPKTAHNQIRTCRIARTHTTFPKPTHPLTHPLAPTFTWFKHDCVLCTIDLMHYTLSPLGKYTCV